MQTTFTLCRPRSVPRRIGCQLADASARPDVEDAVVAQVTERGAEALPSCAGCAHRYRGIGGTGGRGVHWPCVW